MLAEADNELPVTEGQGPCPGELLRKARMEQGMSVEQVAESLHLDEPIVEALESGRFQEVGAPVFVRGHLKAYARILRIPDEPLLIAYRGSQPEAAPALMQDRAPAAGIRLNLSPGPWAMGVLGVCLAMALMFYVLQDGSAPSAVQLADSDVLPEESASVAKLLPVPESANPAPPVPPADPVPAAVEITAATTEPGPDQIVPPAPEVLPPSPEPAATISAAADEPAGRDLELYFREESWAEISDSQRRILFGLQREGMRRQLTGEPPFQILLGNAGGVDVYLDGEVYPVPRRNRGKVARFTIAAAPTENRL